MFEKLIGNSKNILNISKLPAIIPNSVHFWKKIDYQLPFKNNSFDFVYCSEPLEIFKTPEHAENEINRICRSSGLIETKSIIHNIIYKNQPKFMCWTILDTLIFIPNNGNLSGIFIDLEHWKKVYQLEPLYSSNWYTWNYPSKMKICVLDPNYFEDYVDYYFYTKEGLDEFEKNIRIFKKLIQ
jgi:ubiquinone/menaquinone biosynthesis C-methylase UbiE